jgi:hypothetical protein
MVCFFSIGVVRGTNSNHLDKLQTLTDLDSLDALLSSVRNQHVLLKKQVYLFFFLYNWYVLTSVTQLEDAESDQHEARRAAEEHSTSLKQQARQFQKDQEDISRRLMIVTQSDTSDDAVRQFEASMDKLRRLDVADGYIQQLKDVDVLRYCLPFLLFAMIISSISIYHYRTLVSF